ncbi:MAG TPA: hypothetical protein VH092_10270 [Urbifossiella sp.]|nr:hypothetical protein [Urbifossiella sp.]
MRVLVYKRTHNGDPDAGGCFGVHDCMGSVRSREYDAVMGVGGIGPEAEANGIAGKVNWIGVGPRKSATRKRGPHVRFERFLDFGTEGPSFSAVAPKLAGRMYGRNARHVMDGLTEAESAEVLSLLRWADRTGLAGLPTPGITSPRRPRCKRGRSGVC